MPTSSDRTAGPTQPLTRAPLESREVDAMFAAILAIAADAIVTIDESQHILHFNRGAEEIFGYAADEAIGQPLSILLPKRHWASHPAQVRAFARAPETARRMGERREIFGVRKDGSEFPAEASISKLQLADGRMIFTAVLRDVTDRKRAEQDERFLAESGATLARSLEYEQVLRAIVELAVPRLGDAAVLDVLEDGSVREIFGGVQPTEASPEVDRVVVPLMAGKEAIGALTLISTTKERDLRGDARGLGAKFGFSASLSLQNAQLYGEAQRARRARDEVLGVVSHDLRNPISAIAMCARVLRDSPPSEASERRELLDTIVQSTEWTNRLIQDLLDVASLERGRLSLEQRPEDPGEVVAAAAAMFELDARTSGLRLETRIAPDLAAVAIDRGRMVQVLGNLIRNAIKFTSDGGTITVSADRVGAEVVFAVRDTGRGISAEALPHVFDRYWHDATGARQGGSGLGLSIAKGIVVGHGGRITADSEPGKGTTVSVALPVG